MILPLPEKYWNNPSQAYGVLDWETYPQTGRHIGVDFPCPVGTPITALADCTLNQVGSSDALGHWCEVKIDDWYMVCLHLKGQPLQLDYKQGDTIGYTGGSGKIQGVHSHIEGWVNPMDRSMLTKANWMNLTFDITKKIK